MHAVNNLSPHYNSIFLDNHRRCKRNKILCKEKCIFEIFGGLTTHKLPKIQTDQNMKVR